MAATDEIVAHLNAFVAKDDGSDEETLENILSGFAALPNQSSAVRAMFGVMERYPDADLGSPGPIVHAIETLPVQSFLALLCASVLRQPGRLNVWMLNRVLNARIGSETRAELLTLLESMRTHPRASFETREAAERFLWFQAQRNPNAC